MTQFHTFQHTPGAQAAHCAHRYAELLSDIGKREKGGWHGRFVGIAYIVFNVFIRVPRLNRGQISAMGEPFTFRLNDKTNPKRNPQFFEAMEECSADPQKVLRRLTDAAMDFFRENGRLPRFPVRLVEAPKPEEKPRKRNRKID